MTLHWFTPHKIIGDTAAAMSDLRSVGVHFDMNFGNVWYSVEHEAGHELLMKHIGFVVVPDGGQVTCYFKGGCNGRDIRALIGATELALIEPPSRSAGWFRRRNKGKPRWVSEVMVPVDEDSDQFAARILVDLRRGTERPLALSTKVDSDATTRTVDVS